MKAIIFLVAFVFSFAASANVSFDDKKASRIANARKELHSLFDQTRPQIHGNVVALIRFDENGKATVLEINSDEPGLKSLVEKKVKSNAFKNFKNETIRLAVDFRK